MTDTPQYAPGTPIWVDLATTDLDAARGFYSDLFGWETVVMPEPDAGGYTMLLQDGKQVAGMGPVFSPDQPAAWSMYVASDNADAAAQKVRDAGGTVVTEPFDVFDAGRMAVFIDPTGAFFSVWQPGTHRGSELVNTPVSFGWNELHTRDMDAAKPFYQKVFGWEAETSGEGPQTYTEFKLDGRSIAGGMQMGADIPASVPPHWLTYFVVQDTGTTTAKAEEMGSAILMPPTEIPIGVISVLTDPQGAAFALFQTKE